MKLHPKVIYSPHYDIQCFGIEKLHPFDGCKYGRSWQEIENEFGGDLISKWSVSPKSQVTNDELLTVHSEDYLSLLKSPQYVARAIELPFLGILPIWLLDKIVVEPMRWATKGTILAAEEALNNGMSINLSGGYHHASKENGEGFCLYSDIAISIALLRKSGKLLTGDQILIIDLDAHQGNGLERIFLLDKDVRILDMYNRDIYPNDSLAKKKIDCDIPLNSGVGDQEYLTKLKVWLPKFLEGSSNPKIAFYNAGNDIYESDPLGNLHISDQGVFERDKFVFDTLTKAKVPWVMLLSGGYTKESYRLIADSVGYVLRTWGFDDSGNVNSEKVASC
ncbi:MAG: histone deacetylase [Microcystis aeruginosa Ma_MB_F_20061100_S20]|uniref:Histone deacetylase n=1 Tax=Microcystis aeruginosa Ma_MB_F_20061100_S20D TaxID=2486253 RepID=A0A552ECQ7_MICAE|nr:MAG: histone deacetylase [Microcystis aeruginosa Ma_MB_F_20061100_S20D]TRU40208.1 MAG: histone deacetylase [Microcystis aeruginosa Ma_MB_F_20061100_S20]